MNIAKRVGIVMKKTGKKSTKKIINDLEVEEDSDIPCCLVAMPFREDWSQSVFSALEELMASLKIDVYTVDTTIRTSSILSEDVENQVKKADIIIADLTNQNPNVHIEIGFAIANQKEIILCTQSNNDVCAHLREKIYIKYNLNKSGFKDLIRQLRLRIKECLERIKLAKQTEKLKNQLRPIYMVECYKDRGVSKLEYIFSKAKKRIDILTTNLSWLFKEINSSGKSCWDYITDAVERNKNLRLRILTLDPQSEIAAARGKQLGFSPENFREQLQKALDKARTFESKILSNRVEIRIYDELPTQITFAIDDEVYTCIVGQPQQSRKYPVLKFNIANQGVSEAFLAHFLEVWKNCI